MTAVRRNARPHESRFGGSWGMRGLARTKFEDDCKKLEGDADRKHFRTKWLVVLRRLSGEMLDAWVLFTFRIRWGGK